MHDANPAAAAPAGERTVILDDRRIDLVSRLQVPQHLMAAVPLFQDGMRRVREIAPTDRVLGALEIVTVAALVISAVRDLRALKAGWHRPATHDDAAPHGHHGLGWFDIWSGIMLLLEAWLRVREGHHLSKPIVLTALTLLATGVAHPWFSGWRSRRRFLRLDADGLYARLSKFRRLRVAWADVRAVSDDEGAVAFEMRDGRRCLLPLRWLRNAGEVRAVVAEHARAAGVPGPAARAAVTESSRGA